MKYRIYIMDSEPDGQECFWVEDFDTLESARNRISFINSKNNSIIPPDFYMRVEDRVDIVDDE
jgi:hypothetical protein